MPICIAFLLQGKKEEEENYYSLQNLFLSVTVILI